MPKRSVPMLVTGTPSSPEVSNGLGWICGHCCLLPYHESLRVSALLSKHTCVFNVARGFLPCHGYSMPSADHTRPAGLSVPQGTAGLESDLPSEGYFASESRCCS